MYGFSHAETSGWQDPITLGLLIGAVVLLAAFLAIEARVAQPLLPLRVVVDRNRGGSYVAVFVVSAGLFGVSLFLTFYLQTTLGYSAIRTGFAFLPMVVALSLTSLVVSSKLLPRVGPRPLVPPGLVVAAVGLIIFSQLGAQSGYVTHILPGLLVLGVGLGSAISPAVNTATANVPPDDAAVASAMVNTSQQVGGSIGDSLLSTLAASAVTTFMASHPAGPTLAAQAALHSYTVVFWCAAGILAAGAAAALLLLPLGGRRQLRPLRPLRRRFSRHVRLSLADRRPDQSGYPRRLMCPYSPRQSAFRSPRSFQWPSASSASRRAT